MVLPSCSGDRNRRGITILVIQGGNGAPIIRYSSLCKADLILVLDADNELRRTCSQSLPPHVTTFSLGQGHTAKTLAERASPAVQRSIGSAAGMSAHAGLGQLRAIGYLATQRLLDSREMRAFLDETLLNFLMRASGGTLDHVRIIGKGSVAGGTASAGMLLTVKALEKAIIDKSNATVEVELDITGGISYAGLGPRVHKNAAAGVVEALAYVAARRQHNRTIRSLRLMELPPVGDDHAERARFLLEVEQAAQCEEVSDILDRNAPNSSQNGPLGNVTTWRTGHFLPLHPRFHIARDIAPEYSQILREVTSESRPQPSLIHRLLLNTRRQERPREDLDGILARAGTTDANDIIAAVAQPGTKLTITIDAILASDESVCLSDAHTVWATSPASVAETYARLILQNTCVQMLNHATGTLKPQFAAAEHRCRLLARELTRTITAIQRPTLLMRLRQLFSAANPLPERLATTALELRKLADQTQQYRSELQAMQHALHLTLAERDYLTNRISAIATRLESLVPRGQQQRPQPTVLPKQIDAVFQDFWELTAETGEESFLKVLVTAVDHVTEYGLAKITNADPPRLDVIASRIAHHRCTFTPPWGGKPRLLDEHAIHVLPPLTREMGEKLKTLLLRHNPDSTVAIAEHMPASVNCTTLFITPVSDLEDDIFTQYLRASLLDAYHDKNRESYFPSGTSALDEQGIEIDGQVKFRNTTPSQQRRPV